MEEYQVILDKRIGTICSVQQVPSIQVGTPHHTTVHFLWRCHNWNNQHTNSHTNSIKLKNYIKNILRHRQAGGIPLSTIPICSATWKNYNPKEPNDVDLKITIFATPWEWQWPWQWQWLLVYLIPPTLMMTGASGSELSKGRGERREDRVRAEDWRDLPPSDT